MHLNSSNTNRLNQTINVILVGGLVKIWCITYKHTPQSFEGQWLFCSFGMPQILTDIVSFIRWKEGLYKVWGGQFWKSWNGETLPTLGLGQVISSLKALETTKFPLSTIYQSTSGSLCWRYALSIPTLVRFQILLTYSQERCVNTRGPCFQIGTNETNDTFLNI